MGRPRALRVTLRKCVARTQYRLTNPRPACDFDLPAHGRLPYVPGVCSSDRGDLLIAFQVQAVIVLSMMRFLSSPAGVPGYPPSVRGLVQRFAVKGAGSVLLGVALLAAPLAHAQPGRGLFASEEQGRSGAELRRKDWRNTLDGQGRADEREQKRRKMSEEERSNFRQHLRDAARGAYRDEAPPRKGRR